MCVMGYSFLLLLADLFPENSILYMQTIVTASNIMMQMPWCQKRNQAISKHHADFTLAMM